MRPSWNSVWMGLADSLSRRSTCLRAGVGCVAVTLDNHRVLAVGYNGGYRGGPNLCDSSEPGNCGCLHAEENLCIKLPYSDPSPRKLYTTTSPCLMCAKRIINAGFGEVIYRDLYRKTEGLELLSKANVPCFRWSSQEEKEEDWVEAFYPRLPEDRSDRTG